MQIIKPEAPEGFEYIWNGEDWTLAKVAPAPVDYDAVAPADRRRAIVGQLDEIDRASIRPAREITASIAAGLELPAKALEKLADLESQAHALRLEMAAL